MITTQTMPKTITRHITAKVELYNGSTLLNTFNYNDFLQGIDINRTCEENKLFGFVISQKAEIKILDKEDAFTIAEGNSIKVYFDHGEGYISPFPTFYIGEVKRDKVAKEVTITAYDTLTYNNTFSISALDLAGGYTGSEFLGACWADVPNIKGIAIHFDEDTDLVLNYFYTEGANFNGNEAVREALSALADATQSIIFVDKNDNIAVRKVDSVVVDTLTEADYFSYEDKGSKIIKKVAHVTELGDNIEASNSNENGIAYYIRNNAFIELRSDEDISAILATAAAYYEQLSFNLFELKARGNYLYELGDCIAVKHGDSEKLIYLFNDTIKYNGGLSQKIFFNYNDQEQATASPTTIGETLKHTSAKVDKIKQEISLVASKANGNEEAIANLMIATDNILASVSSTQEMLESSIDEVNTNLGTLTQRVEATMTSEEVVIAIQSEIADGVEAVYTQTGYSFDADGLTVSKSGSEMETTITDDGMTVYKSGEEVLTANNEGVRAIDLHADTFLIIGKNSRLEDYKTSRTACFWIGGG